MINNYMKYLNKRGLSPIIASALLIALALILVLLLISYFRVWVGEKTQKDLGSGAEPIESFCDNVMMQVQIKSEPAGNDKAEVNNLGNVPIYGVEIKRVAGGSVKKAGSAIFGAGVSIGSGGTADILGGSGVSSGDEVIVVPIILGENEANRVPYTCDDEFGEMVSVI